MKVLIAVRRLDKGGAEMLECRLAQYLNTVGIETHLLAQYSEDQFDGDFAAKEWIKKGVLQVSFFNSKNNIGIVKSFLQLFLLLRKQKYDIVISTNSGFDSVIGMLKFFISFKHVIAFHTYINKSILKSPRIKLWTYFVRRADAYYSITNYVRNNVVHTLHLNAERHVTVYNSIETSLLLHQRDNKESIRESLKLPADAKIILMAGRIEARKGFDLAVEYLSDLLKQKSVYLVIVGEDYKGSFLEEGLIGFAQVFNQKIINAGLKDKVLFTGYRTDLNQLMKQSDVYVHLARHEGFGLVLLEAIAAKLPIVASSVGGIPEVLQNTPYTPFDLEDSQGICAETVRFLTMNKEEKSNMVDKAHAVLDFYTDERRGSEIKQLVEKLM
ncbi:MAG: hypothetical protein JWO58_522 [Chitinophagaceae bacterium]|nr:hypothetical protein [Chitinophagaceae bacterium]